MTSGYPRGFSTFGTLGSTVFSTPSEPPANARRLSTMGITLWTDHRRVILGRWGGRGSVGYFQNVIPKNPTSFSPTTLPEVVVRNGSAYSYEKWRIEPKAQRL